MGNVVLQQDALSLRYEAQCVSERVIGHSRQFPVWSDEPQSNGVIISIRGKRFWSNHVLSRSADGSQVDLPAAGCEVRGQRSAVGLFMWIRARSHHCWCCWLYRCSRPSDNERNLRRRKITSTTHRLTELLQLLWEPSSHLYWKSVMFWSSQMRCD